MAGIQQVSFTSPGGGYDADVTEIERRRKMAEMLQAQASQPIEQQTAGGWVVPISPTQGFAKVVQGAMGGIENQRAQALAKQLRERQQADVQGDMSAYINALKGRPAVSSELTPQEYQQSSEYGPPNVDRQAQPAIPAGRIDPSLISQLKTPQMQQFAMQQLMTQMTPQEEKFGHTPQIEIINGQPHSVLYGDRGTRKVIGAITPRDKFNTQTADKTAELAQAERHYNSLSANQQQQLAMEAARLGISVQQLILDRARAANQGLQTQFETGSGVVPGMPTLPQIPQVPQRPQIPQAPQGSYAPTQNLNSPINQPGAFPAAPAPRPMAPQPVAPQPVASPQPATPGQRPLSPQKEQELEVARRKQIQEMENKRSFNMGGVNDALNTAERILSGGQKDGKLGGKPSVAPTQSMLGSAADWLGSVVGYAPEGAAEADQLRSIGGSLVAKMPRMEGPQSDKDVQLYREMAGQIGDATLPVSRRLAALKIVRDLYAKYEKTPQAAGGGASGGWKDL